MFVVLFDLRQKSYYVKPAFIRHLCEKRQENNLSQNQKADRFRTTSNIGFLQANDRNRTM